ncbi:MAG: glycine--tRNA ligase subunit beta, partial [Myxococcales bacterium]|nr:glycine--tRNA ligase subunit beta [Myxococcales bacterium]
MAPSDLLAFAASPEPEARLPWALARAAYLSKADLVSQMVFEFPELQGTMGRLYAQLEGQPDDVALAIEEHYLPRGAEGRIPRGDLGALIGLADRLDTVVGIFSVSKGPSGSRRDPFGLRRAVIGILSILRGRRLHLSFQAAVDEA